ncbi:3-oxoacyl-[acyl-carrier-protein] synthase II [Allocatelliglobosispora scoriae]|uniref:3-oxoacyl-[acyl-carrier-protein] synthase II n=1 Tax=Allocatelliglobosispora scoriae TaxID=643052 RepID=A0A841C5F3_9ACTN|nr:beta-ketoacyl-[acyl-carrier-protein] synthase family protein [Allocatelliglobosispora scoriae]MBB5874302.1 3-oxoacyl-[acyl-carrier-protein] synthase II [Allocatelliglobosispora scoriae]
MSDRDIAVTGLGVVCAAGTGTAAMWAGLRAGRSLAAVDPRLSGLPCEFGCAVTGFDPIGELGRNLAWRLDPFAQMAIVAAREAIRDAGLDTASWDPTRVGVIIGTGSNSTHRYARAFAQIAAGDAARVSALTTSRSVPNMAAGEVAMDLQVQGPSFATSSACASGATAIGVARDLLRAGTCDIVVAGGAESVLSPFTATILAQTSAVSKRSWDPAGACRPFDAERDGFVLGEGAGLLVLERPDFAAARNARIRALLTGYAASSDAHHFAAPHPEGRGAAQAMRAALRDAGLDPAAIGHVNTHGTSTQAGDLAEYLALRQVFTTVPPVTATKSIVGHTIGAAGAIEAACTVLALQHQEVPPTANLDRLDPEIDLDVVTGCPRPLRHTAAMSNSFGFGGQNASLVFHTP